jgi:hypothetical protein
MSVPKALRSEVERLGGDPSDLVWDWFLFRGPHGQSFSWGRTRKHPPGYIGLEHLKSIIAEYASTDAAFPAAAHAVAKIALLSDYPGIVRRAIQVIAVVGDESDVDKIESLTNSDNVLIKTDAKACIFELKQMIKRMT